MSQTQTANLDVIVRLLDRASAPARSAFAGLRAGVKGLEDAAKSLGGKLLAAFSVYKLLSYVKESIQLANVQAAAEAKLAAVLRATGGAAGYTAAELGKMAGALQGVTTFGDEAILGAQAILASFKPIGRATFQPALEAVLDLSAAMGQDLKSSAVQIGKALADPVQGISALTRVGVTFTESQKATIQALAEGGQVAKAQALILKELESEFGGVARAMRGTFAGALQAAQNAWGDLSEARAEWLTQSPAVVAALNEGEAILAEWAAELREMGPASADFVAAILTGAKHVGQAFIGFKVVWGTVRLGFDFLVKGVLAGLEYLLEGAEQVLGSVNLGGIFDAQVEGIRGARVEMGFWSGAVAESIAANKGEIDASMENWNAWGDRVEGIIGRVRATAGQAPVRPLEAPGAAPAAIPAPAPAAGRLAEVKPESLTDFWRVQAAERWEVESRGLDRIIQAEKEAKDLREAIAAAHWAGQEDYTDRWLVQAQDLAAAEEARTTAAQEALGALGAHYVGSLDLQRAAAEETARLAQEAGATQEEAARYLQERLREIDRAGLEQRLADAQTYQESLGASLELWAENEAATVQSLAAATVDLMRTGVRGVAQAVGQALVYSQSLGKALGALLKSMAAQVVSFLVELGLKYVVQTLIKKAAEGARMAAEMAGLAAVTYAASFASTVAYLGPAAAGYAAGMTALMQGGAAAAYAQALGVFGALGQAHAGLDQVPRTGTYLLEGGEAVVQKDQNARLARMLDAWERGELGGGQATGGAERLHLEIPLRVGARELARAVVEGTREGGSSGRWRVALVGG